MSASKPKEIRYVDIARYAKERGDHRLFRLALLNQKRVLQKKMTATAIAATKQNPS